MTGLNGNHRSLKNDALLLTSCLSLLAAPQIVAGETVPHGTLELIAAQTSVQPGRPFWVGFRFQMEKGWHIYWTNPGDSGTPPRVKWTLPEGFQAGALQWPIPQRIEDHSLIDYGYQNEVLLPVEIELPASLTARSNVQLSAAVNWVVCREVCLPGRASLSLTLPIGRGTSGPPSAMSALIAKARAELPRPAPKSWKLTASLDEHHFVLNVDTGKRETEAVFFPFEPNQIENAAPQTARPLSRGVRMEMQESDQLLKVPSRLAGVLVLRPGQGYTVEAPVIISKQKSDSSSSSQRRFK